MKPDNPPNNLCRFRILPLPLIAAVCIFYFGCSQDTANAPHSPVNTSQNHEEPKGEHDHSDPEKQKRMGIFHYNQGNEFLRKKEPLEAIKNYKMALQHNPEFFEASINLTTAYLQDKRFEEAHEILRALQVKNPKDPLLFYNLACYYALTLKMDSSLEALKKAVAFGYQDFNGIKSDPDLRNLRKHPKFAAWIESF